jgi:dynein heavy chain
MIWTYSPYYNTPARLVVLIREICNAIITQCQNFVSRDRIFEAISAENPGEAHQCLATCIEVCARFKEAYFDYKAKSKNQWKITTNALFVRLDAFSERCQDIMHLTGTIMQFNKLQKIEIGNTKGKTLTQSITRIFEEFNAAVETFTGVKFDIMDIECREFEDDFFKFRQAIKALERRLASVVTQSFDDCDTIIGKFKLLESFEGLLNRQIIQDEVEKKHVTLLELYKHDLKTVSNIFHEGRLLVEGVDERAPIGLNMPPIAGALNWTAGLLERVKEPFEKLDTLSSSIRDREEYKDVQKLYTSLCRNLKEFEDQKITQWCAGVEENTEPQLNKFLLVRDEATEKCEEGFVRVNFDLILKALLREVKYLLLLDLDVPETASALYAGVDKFRHQTGQLELIVDMYNGMLEKLLPVEKPLFSDRIEKMNKALQPGIDTLMWNSDGIIPYINQAMKIVTEVDVLVKKMKDNVAAIRSKMEDWRKPLFERKAKTADPEMVATIHNATVEAERENIRSQGKDIHKLMKDTLDNIKPDKKGKAWLDYVDYVNGLVIEGITVAIDSSMKFMADQLNIKQNQVNMWSPIFEIKVDLEGGDLAFIPSIEANDRENGIRDIINAIVNDFISIAIQIPRLDSKDAATAGDFLVEIKDQFQLFGTLQEIALNLDEITVSSNKFLDQYRYCDFLWKNDVEQSFREFLNSG